MIVNLRSTSVPGLNRLLVWWHEQFGDFDTPAQSGNLPHGIKLKIEPGVGVYVVPRTAYDASLEIL